MATVRTAVLMFEQFNRLRHILYLANSFFPLPSRQDKTMMTMITTTTTMMVMMMMMIIIIYHTFTNAGNMQY
jgi:hypothetical protein